MPLSQCRSSCFGLATILTTAAAFSPLPGANNGILRARALASSYAPWTDAAEARSTAASTATATATPTTTPAVVPEIKKPSVSDIWVNEEEKFSSFTTAPEELLAKAKAFLSEQSFEAQGAWMSDTDFTFLGPVVGPLGKEDYLKAISGFDVFGIFPDLNPNYYSLTVDPLEEGRVWAISRTTATNKETGEAINSPPQAISVTFDTSGKVTKFTIGAVMDRSVGNTGGLGGLFGPLYAIGKGLPFREARPWKPSKGYRAFMFISKIAAKLQKKK